MNMYIGITDSSWFTHLAKLLPDEVNFWQPNSQNSFKAIQLGELFLFKLHAPENFIVGGGRFLKHTRIPLSLAWEAFGEKNGVKDSVMARNIMPITGTGC